MFGLGLTRLAIEPSKDKVDREIQTVLEREKVNGVHLRMYFGDHYFNRGTMEAMKAQGVTVISGEIKSNPKSLALIGGKKELAREFFDNLKKLPNGVTEIGQMNEVAQRSADLLSEFSKGRVILASDNGVGVPDQDVQDAANEVLTGWSLFGSLVFLAGLGAGAKIANEHGVSITRRQFLKWSAASLGATAVTALMGSSFMEMAQNKGWIELPANKEVSYIFSKLFNKVGFDVTKKTLEIAGDERMVRAIQSLVKVRNQVMALNNWYLIKSVGKNEGLRKSLTGASGNVEIGFFAAWGHAATKDEFCKGPRQLSAEIKQVVNNWLDQYINDFGNASDDDKEKVVGYYSNLMQSFGRPSLIPGEEIEIIDMGVRDVSVDVDTPAAIMFRSLIERSNGDGSLGNGSSSYGRLLEAIVKEQYLPDGTYINVGGKNILSNGKYTGALEAKNPDALKDRFLETGYFSKSELGNIQGELYPNLYAFDYVGPVQDKKVHVGVAIIRGMAMTYFQKEDTSFIKTS